MHAKHAWYAVAAVPLVLLVGGSSPALAQPELGQPIRAIEFDCAAPIDRRGLSTILPMHVGDALRAEDLEEARWRLNQTQIFTEVTIDTQPRDDGVAVLIHLVRKSLVDSVRFRGNHALSDDVLRRAARVQEGNAFSDDLRAYALKRIRERYRAEGFTAVHVEVLVEPRAAGDIRVTFQISEGVPLRIAVVEVEGETPFSADQIDRKSTRLNSSH